MDTLPGPAVARYDEIGPLCLLEVQSNPLLADDPLISRLLVVLDEDPEHQYVLSALAAEGSIRAAARLLHMHHSTLTTRVEKIERAVAADLRDQNALFALRLGLAYWKANRGPAG